MKRENRYTLVIMSEYIDEHNGVRYCELIIIGRRVHISQNVHTSEARKKDGYFFDMIANAIKNSYPKKADGCLFTLLHIYNVSPLNQNNFNCSKSSY